MIRNASRWAAPSRRAAASLVVLIGLLALVALAAPVRATAATVTVHNQAGRLDTVSLYDFGGGTAGLYTFVAGPSSFSKKLFWKSGPGQFVAAKAKLAAGDFNNDGYTDAVALYDLGGGNACLYVFVSDGTRFVKQEWWHSDPGAFDWSKAKLTVGDANGDGKDDVMVLYDRGAGIAPDFLVFTSGGTAFTLGAPVPYDVGSLRWGTTQIAAGDVQGDGTDELLLFSATSGSKARLVALPPAGLPASAITLWTGACVVGRARFAAGDANSDGKDDGIVFYDLGRRTSALQVFVSNGATCARKVAWKSAAGKLDWAASRFAAGDVTGDGRTDGVVLTRVTKTKSRMTTLVSKGTTCRAQASWAGALAFGRARLACAAGVATVVPKTTKRLSQSSLDALASVSPDGVTYTFSHATTQLAALQPGDVIVAPPGPAVPDGVFRKVETVASGGAVLTTSQASLADAFDSCQFSVTRTVTAADVSSKLSSVRGVSIERPRASLGGDPIVVKVDDVSLGGVTVNGTISVKQTYNISADVDTDGLHSFSCTQTTDTHADLDATVEGTLSSKVEQKLASWPLAEFMIWVGVVPVWFEPELSIYVGADGHVTAGVTTGVVQDTSTTLGVAYDGTDWVPVLDQNATRTFKQPELFGGASLKAYAGAELMVKIDFVAGPYVAAELFLALDADTLTNPWWTLTCGIDAKIGAKIEVLDETLADWSYDHNLVTWTLAQAPGSYTPQGAVSGHVVDAGTLAGVEGATVTLRAADGSGGMVARTTSGPGGAYLFSGIAADTYPVEATADGYGVGRRDLTFTGGVLTTDQDISLPPVSASTPFPICEAASHQILPAVSGDVVVWEDSRNGVHNSDIYARDLATDTEFPVATSADPEVSPDISGNIVVYVRVQNNDSNIWATDISTGDSFPICKAAGTQTDPKVSGHYVVWWDGRDPSDYNIYAHDLNTGKNFVVCSATGTQMDCHISGNLVVWLDYRTGDPKIYAARLPNGTPFVVRGTGFVQFPDVSGDHVVWWEGGTSSAVIRGKDVVTGDLFTVFNGGTIWGYGPTIDGDIVIWCDDRADGVSSHLWAKDLLTGVEFPVCTGPGEQTAAAISGDVIVWSDTRNDSAGDIWGCRLQ